MCSDGGRITIDTPNPLRTALATLGGSACAVVCAEVVGAVYRHPLLPKAVSARVFDPSGLFCRLPHSVQFVGARSPTAPDTPHPAIFRAPSRFGACCVWQNLRAVGSARRSWRALLSVLAGDPSQARERLPEPPHSMWLLAPFWSRMAPSAPPPSGYPSILRCAYCPRYRSGVLHAPLCALRSSGQSIDTPSSQKRCPLGSTTPAGFFVGYRIVCRSLLRCAYCPRYRSGACWRIVWALARNNRGAFANCSRHSAFSHIPCAVALWRLLRLAEPPCRRFCQTQLARAPIGSGRRSLAGSGTPARTSALHVAVCSVLVALGSQRPFTPFGESGIAYGFCSFVGYRTVVGKHISPTPLCCSVGLEVATATSNLRGVFVCLALPRAIYV